MEKISFFSDNTAPCHPLIMDALVKGNVGHATAYGNDEDAIRTNAIFKELAGKDVDVIYVPGGTGGNVLAMDSLLEGYQALLCADCCHIHTTEASAFEKITGAKIYAIPAINGKLDIVKAEEVIKANQNTFHHNPVGAISIAQTTEVGTVYTVKEIKAIVDLAHHYGIKVHMDGARISNALASLNVSFKEMCVDTGVDIVTFGGTKNGLMFGEANLFFDKAAYNKAWYSQKQDLQVLSKRRYLPLQFEAFFKDDLYLQLAKYSNDLLMVDLKNGLDALGVIPNYPIESNQAFLNLTGAQIEALSKKYAFAVNKDFGELKEIRLVTCFISTKEEVASFLADLKTVL